MTGKTTAEDLKHISAMFKTLEGDACRTVPRVPEPCISYDWRLRIICEEAGNAFLGLPEQVLERLDLPQKFMDLLKRVLPDESSGTGTSPDVFCYNDWWQSTVVLLAKVTNQIAITSPELKRHQRSLLVQCGEEEIGPAEYCGIPEYAAHVHYRFVLDVCRASVQACQLLMDMASEESADTDEIMEKDGQPPAISADNGTGGQQGMTPIQLKEDELKASADGDTWKDITPAQFAIIKKLNEQPGTWVSGPNLKSKPTSGERPDKIINKLPSSIGARIESSHSGYRIIPPDSIRQ